MTASRISLSSDMDNTIRNGGWKDLVNLIFI